MALDAKYLPALDLADNRPEYRALVPLCRYSRRRGVIKKSQDKAYPDHWQVSCGRSPHNCWCQVHAETAEEALELWVNANEGKVPPGYFGINGWVST